jgi:hypothetical protein
MRNVSPARSAVALTREQKSKSPDSIITLPGGFSAVGFMMFFF